MIIKNYELDKRINYDSVFLFYGKNDGLKELSINRLLNNNQISLKYDQNEIIENKRNFFDQIYSKSLFEKEKAIIIKRVDDKILSLIEEIDLSKISETKIFLDADYLEKKSKLRIFFEKEKNFICLPFYPDTDQILIKLTFNFFKEKKISISPSSVNLIVNKANKNRKVLLNELNKLELYSKGGKKINDKIIIKMINLNENRDVSELVNNYFIKNRKKVVSILNENNFSKEDYMIIVKNFLKKTKRLLNLSNEYSKNKNIEITITSAKPPIFWMDKENTKKQIEIWNPLSLKKLIYKINEIEITLKKNLNKSSNIVNDFLLN